MNTNNNNNYIVAYLNCLSGLGFFLETADTDTDTDTFTPIPIPIPGIGFWYRPVFKNYNICSAHGVF